MHNTDTIIAFVSALMAVFSLMASVIYSIRDRGKEDYFAIDDQYKDIIKEGIKNPSFRDPKMCCNYDKLKEKNRDYYLEYNGYAYLVWNLLKTIYDFSHDKKNKHFNFYEIWLPSILQENKLHYRWFRVNKYLYSEEFQNFVIKEINELEISECNIKEFATVYDMMVKEFPPIEMKDKKHIISLLAKGKYKAYLARRKKRIAGDESFVGFALGYVDDNHNTFFLDYIQINPEYQNCGYGSEFLKLLQDKIIKGKEPVGIIFEVEKDDGDEDVRKRRIDFYLANGAKKLNFDYYLPVPIDQGGKHAFDLMYIPHQNVEKVPKEIFKDFITKAEMTIHSDYDHTKEIISSYIDNVPDYEEVSHVHIKKGEISDLEYIYQFLSEHFDDELIIPKEVFVARLNEGNYELLLAKNDDDEIIAYAFIYSDSDKKYMYLDYFEVLPFFRHQGHGKAFLKELVKNANEKTECGLFSEIPMEVEQYVERLILHCGGKSLNIKYLLPNGKNKIELRAVSYRNGNAEKLNTNDIKNIYKDMLLNLHKDIINKTNVSNFIV